MPRQSKPKVVVSGTYIPTDIHDKELPLKVQWRPLSPDNTYKRIRPNIETIIESHSLPVSPAREGAEWSITACRDVNVRKSSFIKGSKSKVKEVWTEEDRITATYELRGYRYTTGYFYIGLLGQSYSMAGMSSPYVKYRRLSDNTSIDVAKISVIDGYYIVEELQGMKEIPIGMHGGLQEFLFSPIKERLGHYNPVTPLIYREWEHPLLNAFLPSYESIYEELVKNGKYEIPGYSAWVERDSFSGFTGIYTRAIDLKQYVRDWFNTHPVSPTLQRANIPGTRKLERVKDARDRKYSKGKRKKA